MKQQLATILSLVLLALITLPAVGQDRVSKFNVRFGTGYSLLGTGDIITLNYENELNYLLSDYFTTSFSINFGRNNREAHRTASFVQGNWNLFVSPFKNNKRHDLRIGTGLTFYNIADAHRVSATYVNSTLVGSDYVLNHRNAWGYNILVEDTFLLTEKFLAGLKLFTQPYFNGDINSGILIKLGLRL
jgi:hypothetical protein